MQNKFTLRPYSNLIIFLGNETSLIAPYVSFVAQPLKTDKVSYQFFIGLYHCFLIFKISILESRTATTVVKNGTTF